MDQIDQLEPSAGFEDPTSILLREHDARIADLQKQINEKPFKKVVDIAGAGALFLGLILTFSSLYDVFVSKPETDRITRISAFNKAVNSAAALRQSMIRIAIESPNPQLQFAMNGTITPQISNEISTARAILRDLKEGDVEIPQLIILISESLAIGDLANARAFVRRAVAKRDEPSYARAVAKRYEGRTLYADHELVAGHKSYEEALALLAQGPAGARAEALADLVFDEFSAADCENAANDLKRLTETLDQLPNAIGNRLAAP